jgi:hypothetical protein
MVRRDHRKVCLEVRRRLTSFSSDGILDCVVEAFDEIVDPLPLFHEVAKRAV